jgi:hypothetical protein
MSAPLLDHDTILETVRQWPRDAQLALARELLRAAVVSSEYDDLAEIPASGGSWRNLIGLLATDQPPPSDEEIERWREERRIEKYGR